MGVGKIASKAARTKRIKRGVEKGKKKENLNSKNCYFRIFMRSPVFEFRWEGKDV